MKFPSVFAAVLAVAAAAPTTTWTLRDLSLADEHPDTPAHLRPYLEKALNQMMLDIFTGQYNMEPITISTPDGLLSVEDAAPVKPAKVPEAVSKFQPLPDVPEVPESVPITPASPGTNAIDVVAAPDAIPIDRVAIAGAGQGISV